MTLICFNNIHEDISNNPDWCLVPQHLQEMLDKVKPARDRGYLNESEFLLICREKTTRVSKILVENTEETIKRVTHLAYDLKDDPFTQIRILQSLRGVAVPRASCLLAWVFPELYPVIDRRAWSILCRYNLVKINQDGRNLQAKHWMMYLALVRRIAEKHGQTPMGIDRWLYEAFDKLKNRTS